MGLTPLKRDTYVFLPRGPRNKNKTITETVKELPEDKLNLSYGVSRVYPKDVG